MAVSVKEYDSITECLECSAPIRKVKLDYIQKRIEKITEDDLKTLKLCIKCKRKIVRE